MTEQDCDRLVEVKYKSEALTKAIDNLLLSYSAVEDDMWATYHPTIQKELVDNQELAEAQCKILLAELKEILN